MTQTSFDVGEADAYADDSITALELDGVEVVLIRQQGAFYAMPDRCTHAKYPLSDGELVDGKLRCVYHGATFELGTGKPTMPAVKKIRLFQVEERDGHVHVIMQEA